VEPGLVGVPSATTEDETAAAADGSIGAYREWRIPMPAPGAELHDALLVALEQAQSIHGRKYRYGAILLSGEDHIPLRSGSNKTPFQRDKIHAEMSALKGYPRPEGKDMLIGRLAPVRPPGRMHACMGSDGVGACSDDDGSDEGEPRIQSGSKPAIHGAESSRTGADRFGGKILNARPCNRCEARMAAKGTRPCLDPSAHAELYSTPTQRPHPPPCPGARRGWSQRASDGASSQSIAAA
jgi:hypothetical protein